MSNKKLHSLAQKIEDKVMEFGDIPTYSIVAKRIYMYVCKNNGQHHDGTYENIPGNATFVGKFSYKEALDYFAYIL